jgi:NCS2 family nucleobase:cation symporter-2
MNQSHNRAPSLLYGENDKVPLGTLILLAFQYVATCSTFLLLPILVMKGHVSTKELANIISIAMILCAVSALLQGMRCRYVGAGIFGPGTPNPAYLSAAIYAVNKGGVNLLAGMTFIAGFAQIAFTYIFERLKRFIPAELGFLVIAVIGLNLGIMGISKFAALSLNTKPGLMELGIGIVSLITMFTLYVFAKGLLKIFALLIGIILAYILTLSFGLMNAEHLTAIGEAPWILIPKAPAIHLVFSQDMMIPFIIAALVCATKVTGSMTALQQSQVKEWHNTNMKQINRAGYADGLVNLLAGLTGSLGYNFSSSAMALSVANGVCSRFIAIPYAIIFVVLALCPKVSYVFVFAPNIAIAATLIFLGTSLFGTSFKLLIPLMKTYERRLIVGLSFMFGLSYQVHPHYYENLPNSIKHFTGSSIALATIVALVLNMGILFHSKKFRVK